MEDKATVVGGCFAVTERVTVAARTVVVVVLVLVLVVELVFHDATTSVWKSFVCSAICRSSSASDGRTDRTERAIAVIAAANTIRIVPPEMLSGTS